MHVWNSFANVTENQAASSSVVLLIPDIFFIASFIVLKTASSGIIQIDTSNFIIKLLRHSSYSS